MVAQGGEAAGKGLGRELAVGAAEQQQRLDVVVAGQPGRRQRGDGVARHHRPDASAHEALKDPYKGPVADLGASESDYPHVGARPLERRPGGRQRRDGTAPPSEWPVQITRVGARPPDSSLSATPMLQAGLVADVTERICWRNPCGRKEQGKEHRALQVKTMRTGKGGLRRRPAAARGAPSCSLTHQVGLCAGELVGQKLDEAAEELQVEQRVRSVLVPRNASTAVPEGSQPTKT